MSISLWASRHWSDLTWFPLWFTGMPFHQVYQPGFHLTVAGISTLLHWPIPKSYHFTAAVMYVLGPVFLFLLLAKTGSRGPALLAALVFSLTSPSSMLSPAIAADTAGMFDPRRLQILVAYGEGPHLAALTLLPLAILFLHRSITDRRPLFFPLAIIALGSIVITNWPGTVALAFAVAAYLLSRLGQRPPISWLAFVGICASAYLLICPWVPPSLVAFVRRAAAYSDSPTPIRGQLIGLLCVSLAIAVLHVVFLRLRSDPWLRFFAYFTLITGAPMFGNLWFQARLLPQPTRWQMDFEMAFAGLSGYLLFALYKRIGNRSLRIAAAAAAALVILCVVQLRTYTRFATREIRSTDITKTVEYRMAKVFEQHFGEQRVFAPGNVAYWLNMFTDVPQVTGCCAQSVPTAEHHIATFVIYSGMGTGDRDADISILWLKAYGASAVGVTGPKSSEPYKPFAHPEKFEGVLPAVWREGDDAVYAIPRRSASPAQVIKASDVIMRAPVNGLDIEPIEPYVKALDNPQLPLAEFHWTNNHEALIRTDIAADQLLSVQMMFDSGWHASVNSSSRPIRSDALGMMVIEPRCSGPCVVQLVYDPSEESRFTRLAMIIVVIGMVGWSLFFLRRANKVDAR